MCAELLRDVLTHHRLVLSDFIVDEVTRKLHVKFEYPGGEILAVRRFLKAHALQVTPVKLPGSVCRDPDDIPVLGTAVAGQARVLISVDKDLLSLEHYEGIVIIKPGEFWRHAVT